MSAPTADRLVHDARIGPDDTPHEAAAHLWAQVVANHPVDPDGPLSQLGVLDRVVLVLVDVMRLSPATIAEVLHTGEPAVRSAHDAARTRLGLPAGRDLPCHGWAAVRGEHAPGDPAVLRGLLAHARDCPTCSGTAAEDRRRSQSWWTRAAVGAAAPAAVTATPALAGTLAAAAAIVTAGVAVGALVGPVPEPPLPEPVVVDEDPQLPSDEEPPTGWPAQPLPAGTSTGAQADAADEDPDGTTQSGTDDTSDTTDATDPLTDPLQDTTDDALDTLDDTVDDVTDTVGDTAGDLTDTVEDTTDEAGETLDDASSTLEDTTEETVQDTTDTAQDTVDSLP